jgi:hypothetical protein
VGSALGLRPSSRWREQWHPPSIPAWGTDTTTRLPAFHGFVGSQAPLLSIAAPTEPASGADPMGIGGGGLAHADTLRRAASIVWT